VDELAVLSIEPPPELDPWTLPTLVLDAAEEARALFIALTRPRSDSARSDGGPLGASPQEPDHPDHRSATPARRPEPGAEA
jgi:hypothetical protein